MVVLPDKLLNLYTSETNIKSENLLTGYMQGVTKTTEMKRNIIIN